MGKGSVGVGDGLGVGSGAFLKVTESINILPTPGTGSVKLAFVADIFAVVKFVNCCVS